MECCWLDISTVTWFYFFVKWEIAYNLILQNHCGLLLYIIIIMWKMYAGKFLMMQLMWSELWIFRSFVKRCFSDGSIIHGKSTPTSTSNPNIEKFSKLGLQNQSEEGSNYFCDSSPEISTFESDMAFSRFVIVLINVNVNM